MLTAEILYPDTLHGNRKCSCVDCGLSYIKKDYKTLFDAWKLKYFKLLSTEIKYKGTEPDVVVCHNCLFEVLKDFTKSSSTNLVKFLIMTRNQQIELEFNTEQHDLLQSGTRMDDFLATLDALDGRDTDDTREDDTGDGRNPDWGV